MNARTEVVNPKAPRSEQRYRMRYECILDKLFEDGEITLQQREAGLWFRKWYERVSVGPAGAMTYDGGGGGGGGMFKGRPDAAMEASDKVREALEAVGAAKPLVIALLGEGRDMIDVCRQFGPQFNGQLKAFDAFCDSLDKLDKVRN